MKHLLLLLAATFSLGVSAQIIYSEDFDGITGPTAGGPGTYTFASGFLLRNVDNKTPATSVSYVNEAWERREDFNFTVTDSAAFSTSWYTPAGAANDWMWTPAVAIPANTILKWNAVTYDPAYPDGYEVRIMTAPTVPTGGTGVIGNQITNSTVIFSTTAEATAWTAHQVPLSAYAGQTVYIGFRLNTNDKFLLLIDDIVVEQQINYNLAVTTAAHGEYTILTADNATTAANIQLTGTVNNVGLQAMTNVALGCQVWVNGSLLTTVQSTVDPSLAAGANVVKTINYSPTVLGDYDFKFYPIATQADLVNTNDTLVDPTSFILTDDYLGRDDGTVVGSLGIGAGNGGYLGQVYNIETTTQFAGVDVYFTQGYTGRNLAVAVYNTNGSGVPTTFFAGTDTLTYIDDSARLYHLPFNNGLSLSPGKYGFMAIEFDSTLAVGNTSTIFKTNTVFVNWPTNPSGPAFTPVETFGVNVAKSFVIRPNVDVCFGEIGGTLDSTGFAGCGSSDGYAELTLDPGYTVTWEDGSTAPVNTALPAGYNTYTIMNANCTFIDSVLTINATAPLASVVTNQASPCEGEGQVVIDVTGGTAPYTITWSNGDTGLTLDAIAGSYSASIIDDNNCAATVSVQIVNTPSPVATIQNIQNVLCNGGMGLITLSVAGGTAPYTTTWSNGDTGLTLDDIAGTYSATVTDDNGCTVSVSSIAITQPAVLASVSSGTNETCASCNDGTAQVTVSGGTPTYSYVWSNGGTTNPITGLAPGVYTVDITDDNGCTTTGTYTVTQFDDTGIDELATIGITVYPNPIVDFLSVESNNQTIEKLTVYDAAGKLVMTGTSVLDFRKIASGSYQLVIQTDKKEYRTTVVR